MTHTNTPDFEAKLDRYAKLAVCSGCNLQQGQELFIVADISAAALVRKLVAQGYEQGASNVTVRWGDEVVGRMHYDKRPLEAFEIFPDWLACLQNGMASRGAALLFVTSEDPEALVGVDQRKLVAYTKAAHVACKEWRDGMDFGRNVWCIIGAASPTWARRVFPQLPEDEAISKLWDAIFTTVRVNAADPIAAWEAHKQSFARRKEVLNSKQLDSLHYTNSLGTDICIGLTPKSLWQGGGAETVGGTYFFPNMPTEEIFTSPDYARTEGTVVASMPLNHNGSLVEGFSFTFKEGKVVDFAAEKGYEVLKELLETDEGARHLGEAALIPCSSPIKQTGILFLNTLYDENASCHFALGMGFPDCYDGGLEMNKEQLLAAGINDSATHVDFMLGTDDLSIVGTTADGEEFVIFRDGDWAF